MSLDALKISNLGISPYYESAFCLNEAGVIWYLDDALALPIGLPEVDHTSMIGFLNSDTSSEDSIMQTILLICI